MHRHHPQISQTVPTDVRRTLVRWGVIAFVGLTIVVGQSSQLSAQVSPDKLKAVYLYNFGNYIEWPIVSTSVSSNSRPFVIGILAKAHPVHAVLEEIARKKTVRGRKLKPVFITGEEETPDWDIVYIPSETPPESIQKPMSRLKEKPILLVSERPNFASFKTGGMINFFLDRNAIRFEINPDTIVKARLKASAKLIQLGTVIRD